MGLEGAWGLKEGGLEVTVLETAPGLLPRQLDDVASEMLKELCIEAGVDIVTGAKIAEITENAVVLEDGTEYEAQLVIMSTGMRPYTKVAEDSGIAGRGNRQDSRRERRRRQHGVQAYRQFPCHGGLRDFGICPWHQRQGS